MTPRQLLREAGAALALTHPLLARRCFAAAQTLGEPAMPQVHHVLPAVLLTQTEAEELHTALGTAIALGEREARRLAARPWTDAHAEAAILQRHLGTLRAYWAALQEAHAI